MNKTELYAFIDKKLIGFTHILNEMLDSPPPQGERLLKISTLLAEVFTAGGQHTRDEIKKQLSAEIKKRKRKR